MQMHRLKEFKNKFKNAGLAWLIRVTSHRFCASELCISALPVSQYPQHTLCSVLKAIFFSTAAACSALYSKEGFRSPDCLRWMPEYIEKQHVYIISGQQSHCQQELLEMELSHSMCMQGLSRVRRDLVIEIPVFSLGGFATSKSNGNPKENFGSWRSQGEPKACLLPGTKRTKGEKWCWCGKPSFPSCCGTTQVFTGAEWGASFYQQLQTVILLENTDLEPS